MFHINLKELFDNFPFERRDIGWYLSKIREELGLSQSAMSKSIKVSQSTYSKYENNEIDVPTDKIELITELYELPTNWYRGGLTYKQQDVLEEMIAEFEHNVRLGDRHPSFKSYGYYHPTLFIADLLRNKASNRLIKLWLRLDPNEQFTLIREWFRQCSYSDMKRCGIKMVEMETFDEELPILSYDPERDTLVKPFEEDDQDDDLDSNYS